MTQSALFVSILALGASGCSGEIETTTPAPTPVRAAIASDGPAAPAIRTSGLLFNKDEIRLSFKVGGVIRRLDVREGEHVRKGQLLAQIEQAEISAHVEQARQAHDKALRDRERGERLYADKVISLEQLQDLRTQTAVAQAALKSAEFNRSHATIVAPGDGTVLRRLAEERELVAAGAPVLVLGTQDQGYVVRAGLADREIVQVALGDTAQIRLDALPEARLQGVVTELASAAEESSGLFVVGISVENDKLPLKSGLVAKLQIVPRSARARSRVHIPVSSVVEGNGEKASVFVLENNRATRRAVQVAFIEDGVVALTNGIASGERVVTDGALYLEDGERVSVRTEAD